jgi:hypothetical protein
MPRRRSYWQCVSVGFVWVISLYDSAAFVLEPNVPGVLVVRASERTMDPFWSNPFHIRYNKQRKSNLRSYRSRLPSRPYRYSNRIDHDDEETSPFEVGSLMKQLSTERPTQTLTEPLRPPALPAKSKIVVLGASGLIGRLVVRQLLETPQLDATIVALVRDYDKACRVLYDDLIVASSRRKGSKLVIVQGDLVPPEELPGYSDIQESDDDDDDGVVLVSPERSEETSGTVPLLSAEEDVLQESIRDCTTIISCLGTVRITNVWTDFLVRPLWRLLRHDVSDWCSDPHHPYYVHYRTTQKVIHYAEREQIRRQAAMDVTQQEQHSRSSVRTSETPPRIRFIRVSDLCVAQPPWFLIPLLTNIFHSMVFRYQLLADRLLDASAHLDTITIRPGDVVADERNVETTALQVDPSGVVPYPARVGRDDTAELVVAAALWSPRPPAKHETKEDDRPFHFTWACRWVGRAMDPFPAQGDVSDGLANAHQCVQSVVQGIMQETKDSDATRLTRRRSLRSRAQSASLLRTRPVLQKKQMKPYGICAAIPVYTFLLLLVSSVLSHCPEDWRRWWQAMRQTTALFLSFLSGPLIRFVSSHIPIHRVEWLLGKFRPHAVHYISF